ncbi:S-adenosyl-L-methionine-dependent methyltransferase [Venustampulla echinocandica]|uniref:catechol O-methyltransferase n=1 Tax=Venustampulla echinocandica TaxID=2656787 RepID=A0A370TNN4_9HELO|nr:S-adenosyl-L-methionine-dependent methyltransferase [Venustampulla echinocandica]RDL37139.1 S-adenosyl-L-methionine-dependent methyltransferase [Venustampulla echinocandica]
MTATTSPANGLFDPSKAYKEWEVNGKYFGDGREVALLEYMYNHPSLPELRGNPTKILAAIDTFAQTVTGLINIGESKGHLVTSVIAQHKPTTILELGGYIGYSAIMFSSAMKAAGGKHYYSVEKNPLFAAVATALVDLAGLRDTVRVIVGTGAEGIQRLVDEQLLQDGGSPLGMMFFDHHKPSYTADLKLCERLGLVGAGTVLVADNMILPGNPPYAEWVRATVAEKKAKTEAAPATDDPGNPNLQYKSRFVKSFEPSGMEDALEITECVGIEA